MYARTINSYLTWLHEEGHVERLRIKLLPNPPKPDRRLARKYRAGGDRKSGPELAPGESLCPTSEACLTELSKAS